MMLCPALEQEIPHSLKGQIEFRLKTFEILTRNVHPHKVAVALGLISHGVDWRGCSKGHMKLSFALGEHGLWRRSGVELREKLNEAMRNRS